MTILMGGLCAAQASNLVSEGRRDLAVPFQGAGKMGMAYTPCFFPKDTEAVLFTCEFKIDGVEAGAQKWFDARILTDYNWAQTTNQTILVSGAAPRIELTTAFRNSSDAAASLQNADTAFLFTVPKDGWADAAISSDAASEAFGGMLGGGEGRTSGGSAP